MEYLNSHIRNFVPPTNEKSLQSLISESKIKVRMIIYVNPYTGEILRTQECDGTLMHLIRKFHSELLMTKFGVKFVELAGC